MIATRDALAHRFIAIVLPETGSWPPALQVTLHDLAFAGLPEAVLALPDDAAREWVRSWRALRDPSFQIAPEIAALIAAIAENWRTEPAAQDAPAAEPDGPIDVEHLARMMERLGPLALSLPWRREPPARA